MGVYQGKDGMVDFNGVDLLHIQEFTFNTSVDMADITEMGNTWENHAYGLADFSASVTCLNADAFDTVTLLGTSAVLTIELTDGGADKIVGTAILSSISETQGVDGVGTITYGFEGNDSDGLTYTIS